MSAHVHRSHLDELEAEAVHIMREVAAELERPVLLFSGGKDSIVLLRLAERAFRPGRFPFPLMHVDTGHNFPEVIEYRDRRVAELGERLVVASVQESIDTGRVVEQKGPRASRNQLQTTTLLDAMESNQFDAAIGGARRDEERSRAKERIFSFRDDFGQWDPAGAVEPLQREDPQGRAGSRVPDLQLDRARRLAVRGPRGPRAAVDLLRPRARGVRARRDAVRDLGRDRA
jgi:sulfate adenylyltransferase subunit 2